MTPWTIIGAAASRGSSPVGAAIMSVVVLLGFIYMGFRFLRRR
jgi:hypothetical protein